MPSINPIPKDYRRKGRIDCRTVKYAKTVPDRDKEYLRFVRSQVCATWSTECGGVTEAAHLETFWRGKKASDYYTAPLCTYCHRLQHQIGLGSFQVEREVNLWRVAAKLVVRYMNGERAE